MLHEGVKVLKEELIKRAETDYPHLIFECNINPDADKCMVLCHITSLINCLVNLTMDPAQHNANQSAKHSQIVINRRSIDSDEIRITFRLLTSFADATEVQQRMLNSPSNNADKHKLQKFGVLFDDSWKEPTAGERDHGFRAAFELHVMTGFVPRTGK
jgi:hypothetical protein